MNRHLTKEDVQIANKHMKKTPTTLVIGKMQIKATRRITVHPEELTN